MRACLIAVIGSLLGAGTLAASDSPTFYKDVLPVLQANCQSCHRPGEVAPMSLLTYESSRPWAKAIKTAVVKKQMPPWFADPAYGHFANERRLSERDIQTLTSWADAGAPAGDAKDAPAPLVFENGWNIKPDVVDRDAEALRGAGAGHGELQVHPGQDELQGRHVGRGGRDAAQAIQRCSTMERSGCGRPDPAGWRPPEPGEAYEQETQRTIIGKNSTEEGNDILGKFNPGLGAQRFDMEGAAKFIPKGSDLVYEMHYTTTGKPTSDVSKLGLVLAKNAPEKRYYFHAGPTALNLSIPPGDGKAEVVSEITLGEDAKLVYAQPHMHLRGKDFELRVVYPNKEREDGAQG